MYNMRGGFGGGNMQNLIRQAEKLQKDMLRKTEEADAELASTTFTTTAGGGMVEVQMRGNKEIVSIKISPEVVDSDDVELLEDLITAAMTEAISKATALESKLKEGINGGMF